MAKTSSLALLFAFLPLSLQQTVKEYSCINNENICSNICYYQDCAHPYDPPNGQNVNTNILTHSTDQNLRRIRRQDCGADHNPNPCQAKPNGLGIPGPGPSPDEFPFASSTEGGLTPFGDGASILCVPNSEQQSQAAKVTNFWRGIPDGSQAALVLQDTTGIKYCDPEASPPLFCDGSLSQSVHFYKSLNRYCQWGVSTAEWKCYDGATGNDAPQPAALRVASQPTQSRQAGRMLHRLYPGLAEAMWNEERDGPMPEGYPQVKTLEEWLERQNISRRSALAFKG